MSEKKQVVDKIIICKGPFGTRVTYDGQKDFDKYYLDVQEKDVFKPSGEKDPDTGDELGVIVKKFVVKKIDIREMLNEQMNSVGVESYIRALALQGEDINDFNTQVSDTINDYSQLPDTLAGVMTAGDKAKVAFANLDPALKGNHTTIEGFLSDLTQDKFDSYIKTRIEALTSKQEVKEGE